ncbi:MAG: M56 family metallopeptidase, partial [Wenzhouxiangella sp.]|nr:M56 family metallopeptidase [Wenzhouxiangella sp.]
MTADLLALLFEATLLTSAAVLAVLFLRGVWRRAFGVRAAILLWLIVPLAAGVAIAPDRMVEDREALEIMAPVQAWLLGEDPPTPDALERTGAEPFGAEVVLVAWTIGSMLMLGLLAIRQRRFRAGLGRLGACGGRLWVSEKEDIGPLVLGVISPKVIVPANFAER